MSSYVGVDLGTTSITGVVVEAETKRVVADAIVDNDTEVTSPEDRARGRSEWDIDRMVRRAFGLVNHLVPT